MTQMDLRVCDCNDGMRSLPSESVDVVVTSPPYNLGIKYKVYKDNKRKKDYINWTVCWAMEVSRVLKPLGSFFLNIGGTPASPMLPHEIIVALNGIFKIQNTIHWVKAISVTTKEGKLISPGHFKPINSKRFITDCHEYIFHLTKTGRSPIDRLAIGVPYADKSNLKRWKHSGGKDVRCRGNTWFLPYHTIQDRVKNRPHPATFPKELPAMCFKLHGSPSDMVGMDPFLGIGNSAVAAQELGLKRFVGFDIDDYYVSVAKDKVSQPPLLASA